MELFTLLAGKSKKRMRPIMTDAKHKCENFMEKRLGTTDCPEKFYEIVPAAPDADQWKKKSSNRKTGWIGKNGWNPHTWNN